MTTLAQSPTPGGREPFCAPDAALAELAAEIRAVRWLLRRTSRTPVPDDRLEAVRHDVELIDHIHMRRIETLVETIAADKAA